MSLDRVASRPNRRYVAFDIETTGLYENGVAPGITCAATRLVDGTVDVSRSWHSDYASVMTADTANAYIEYLCALQADGVTVVSFNGGAFDLKVLFDLTNNPRVRELAARHCDVMYQFLVENGYFASLQSFCEGAGIAGKTGAGVDAIAMWAEGDKDEVLSYCINDVRVLGDVYAHILENSGSKRQTKGGKTRFVHFTLENNALLSVAKAAKRVIDGDVPCTKWMTKNGGDAPDMLAGVKWIWPA